MKEHQRNAAREESPKSPSEAYLQRHGWGAVDELVLLPDRIAAWMTESVWTCALAARGVEVFGQNPGDLCPGKVWRDARAEWGINWQNPRTPTLCVDAHGHVRTALVGA
jgi:hypothetical protein